MNVIDTNGLFNILFSETGKSTKFINIETLTEVKTLKKHRVDSRTLAEIFHTHAIYKRSSLPVQINVDYTNSVNNRREKAGEERDFESSGLPWGKFVANSKILIEHNGEHYVRVFQTNSVLGKIAIYEKANGQILTDEEVKILKEGFLSVKPEFIESQGLSYQESSKPNCYKLKNITSININNQEYKVVA